MTRTLFLGKPTKKEIDFYNQVLNEKIKLEKSIKAGTQKIETIAARD